MDERVTELEIRLTHMEDTLDIINQTVIDQHQLIDRLQLQITVLEKKLKAASESQIADEKDETLPPHY